MRSISVHAAPPDITTNVWLPALARRAISVNLAARGEQRSKWMCLSSWGDVR